MESMVKEMENVLFRLELSVNVGVKGQGKGPIRIARTDPTKDASMR